MPTIYDHEQDESIEVTKEEAKIMFPSKAVKQIKQLKKYKYKKRNPTQESIPFE